MKNKARIVDAWIKVMLMLATIHIGVAAKGQGPKWICVPGKSAGPINSSTSEKNLKEIFGLQNVRRAFEERPYGERPQISVTQLLANGVPYATVYWENEEKRYTASAVAFYGKGQCILEGVNLVGITLEKLEQANGKQITMTGLHSYEDRGQLVSWHSGKFAKYKGNYNNEKMEIRLDYCSLEGPRNKCDQTLEKSDFISSADVGCKSDICVITVEIILNK